MRKMPHTGRAGKIGNGVSGLAVGQRVTVQPNFSCGNCAFCLAGHRNICPSKVRLGMDTNGVFAEFVKVPAAYVWPVPDGLEDEVAVFTEPLAVIVHVMNRCAPKNGARTLIFGVGFMGLLALQLSASIGTEVTACDILESRLELAKRLGACRTLGTQQAVESMHDSFDVIYETSGAPEALDQVIRLAAPRGRIVVLGLPGKDHSIPTNLIVRKELKIMGSLIYTNEFPESMDILKSGRIKTDLLNTGKLSLNEIDRGLRDFVSPERTKMLVKII